MILPELYCLLVVYCVRCRCYWWWVQCYVQGQLNASKTENENLKLQAAEQAEELKTLQVSGRRNTMHGARVHTYRLVAMLLGYSACQAQK